MPDTTAPPTAWTLELSLTSGDLLQQRTEEDPDTTTAIFTDLSAGTEYRVRVAGVNTRGTGLFSDTATASTNSSNNNSTG